MENNIYDNTVSTQTLVLTWDRLTNQIFRLLPTNEEGQDWIKPLETILIEIAGISSLYPNNLKCFSLLAKLQGIYQEKDNIDFLLFRRMIFECCSLAQEVKKELESGDVEYVFSKPTNTY